MNERLEVIFNGLSLVDRGLVSDYNTLSGVGLNTFGFIWAAQDIWADADAQISTSWSNADGTISTTWSSGDPAVTTIWTLEYPQ